MADSHENCTATYAIRANELICSVTYRDGKHYAHACPRLAFERIVLQVANEHLVTLTGVCSATGLSVPAVQAALDFLVERSCLWREGRRFVQAVFDLHDKAVDEWNRLAAEGQP